jgi:hypothetical protein
MADARARTSGARASAIGPVFAKPADIEAAVAWILERVA